MVKSDSSTVLFSQAQWQTDAADVTVEDMNLLFLKFTFDFFHSIKETPKTKEVLISSWNNIIKSKTQISNLANSLPEIPICTCKDNNNLNFVFCDLCHYWYHLSCLHENANFNTNFPLNGYVCPCCIHGKFASFFGYLSLSSVLLIDGSKESITDAYKNWKKKSENIKKDLEMYYKPNPSIVKQLPVVTELKILSKNGISNYYNNCYISVIIHSLFGNAIANFFPSSSNYSPLIQKALDVCKSKIRCPKRVEERLNKRKLGVNLTDQLKILSKDLMGTLLKEKMHHDAIEFLENFLKNYDEYILDWI